MFAGLYDDSEWPSVLSSLPADRRDETAARPAITDLRSSTNKFPQITGQFPKELACGLALGRSQSSRIF